MSSFFRVLITIILVLYFKLSGLAQNKIIIDKDTYLHPLLQSNIDSIDKKNKPIHGFVAASLFRTSNQQVPLWMRSIKYGGIHQNGVSTSLVTGSYKEYNLQRQQRLLDWSAGINLWGNIGDELDICLLEAYAKARVGIFQLSAGRTKDITGLVDSTFSTGAFSISGNALGIPKVELSTPGFWEIPFTQGLIAFKGSIAHGWLGKRISYYTNYSPDIKYTTYLHQKTLYGRFGKPHWRVHLYAGLNHEAMWGNEQKMFENFGLTEWETFKYVFIGKAYSNWSGSHVPGSKIGNHLGSIDQAIVVKLNQTEIFAYHQFYYEAGALAKLANVKDGTWGVSIKNLNASQKMFNWKKVLFEFIFSKSQGGEVGGPMRPSQFEDYYNNSYYIEGWSYGDENIGNVLFTSKKYIREDLPIPDLFFVNNRLCAFHSAFEFSYKKWQFISKHTFSENHGHYRKSPEHRGFGNNIIYHDPPYFGRLFQYSGYINATYSLKNNWGISMALACDQGKVLYNSVGGKVKVVKKW